MKRQRSSSSSKARAAASATAPAAVDSPATEDSAPPPKKVMRRVKVAPPTTLGSLPLYGEKLPDGGYSDVPPAAQHICSQLKEVVGKIKTLKQSSEDESEVEQHKHRGMVLFASLKRYNRLSHLYCKDTREQTHEQKLEVDDLHLQLQNLMYEAMHLRREITSCLQFKSQHEEIELVSEAEFFRNAPESVARPEVTRSDEHQRMLCRLEWELEQRKGLAQQQCELEGKIAELEAAIGQKEDQVSGLQPALEALRKATLPLQDMLGMPLDRLRDERGLARLLPLPLYVVYMQARAYSEVEDKSLTVTIEGDATDAQLFQNNSTVEPSDEDSGESDGEGGKEGEEGTHRKRKRKTGKSSSQEKDVSKAHPLSIVFTLDAGDTGSMTISISFVPNFSAVCASVTSIAFKGISEAQQSSIFLEKSAFLHCLFEGDTGRTSPNAITSLHIRRLGGDKFSSAVRQYGFPYKWVQRVCGIEVSLEIPEGVTSVEPKVDTSAENMGLVVKALKQRFLSQVYLSQQILALDEHKLTLAPNDEKELFPYKPQSQLIRWKYVTLAEVQGTTQFARDRLSLFNLQERTSRFFVATLQLEQARLHALVRLAMDYPATPPCFVVRVEPSAGQRELQTKNVEAEVNIQFPRSLEGDRDGQYLLSRQLRRLQECFEVYAEHQSATATHRSKQLHRIRGRGRLLVFDEGL